MRRLVPVGFFLAILSSVTIFAQSGELVSAVEVGRMNAEQFNKRTSDVYGADAPVPLNGRLTLYKVTYRSKDARGRNTILSGLIVIPSNGAQNGLVLFNHGTIVYRQAAPSRFSPGRPSARRREPLRPGVRRTSSAAKCWAGRCRRCLR